MRGAGETGDTAVAPPPVPHGAALSVTEGYCINLRGRLEACDLCQRVCHADAITLTLGEVTIDPVACAGCGACVPACPAGAITHDGFDPEALIAGAISDGVARIGCRQSGGDGLPVPCHRMLDARMMAALFAEGAERIELIGLESCHGCPGGDARPALRATLRDLTKWFGEAAPAVVAAGKRAQARDDAPARAARRAVGRRRLLRGAFVALSDPPPEPHAIPSFDDFAAAEDTGEGFSARPVPYQQALARRRASLPFREDGPVGATGRLIGEECSGCMVCADLCPTGALGGEAEPGHRLVSFDPALCTNCTLCLKVCPMDAISARALRGVAEVMEGRRALYARSEQICVECGGSFAPDQGSGAFCPKCENDHEMDDEWLEMLSG